MDDKKEKKFISERILGREMTLRRALRWTLVSFACGLVFGLSAFGVNFLAKSVAENAEKKQQEIAAESTEAFPETAEPVTEETLPQETEPSVEVKETPSETAETEHETEDADREGEQGTGENETADENTESLSIDPALLHEALQKEQEDYPFGTVELNLILNTQAEACENISEYIARVSNTISTVTWFESTVETRRDYSGIIVSVSESEILLLTVSEAVRADGSLSVTFHDGTRNGAVTRKVSERDGLAVVAVPTEGLGADFIESLKAVEIAAAEQVRAGVPVITAGSPMGAVGSFGFGSVGYVAEPESVEDGNLRSCYSEAPSVPEKGTFLMSVDGKLLGLAAEKTENSEAAGNRFLLAESCLSLIENLKKGNDMAWLGITGVDISFDMKNKSIPEGMYVAAVNEEGPAFDAGLRRGDIIVMIGAREIGGISDYMSFLKNLRPGETVNVTVLRETVHSEYREMELQVTAGTR